MMTTVVHYIYALINQNKKNGVFFSEKQSVFISYIKDCLYKTWKKGVDLRSKYMITDVKYIFR